MAVASMEPIRHLIIPRILILHGRSFEKQIGFSRKPLARPYHGNTECRGDPTSVRALVLLESKLAELRHGDCLRQWFPPKDCGHVVGGRPRRCAWRARHDRRPRYRESVCRAEPNRR